MSNAVLIAAYAVGIPKRRLIYAEYRPGRRRLIPSFLRCEQCDARIPGAAERCPECQAVRP